MLHESHIARNLRRCREAAGLRQRELAARLYVSPQTVSKWESGTTVPDLENLCRIASVLSVPADALLGDGGGEVAYLGIDGGGTKTEFALSEPDGRILRRVCFGGCNPTVCGMGKTLSLLTEGIDALSPADFTLRGVFAGIAGCSRSDRRETLVSYLSRRFPSTHVDAGSDILNIIYSTPHRDPCIAAICGTGSVVFAKVGHQLHRVGGWGPLLDTSGSGFDIGRDAIRAALSVEDGLGAPTALRDLVRRKCGGDIFSSVTAIPPTSHAQIAAFAPLVFDAYRAGDPVASEILDRNFARLADLIASAARRYSCGSHVVLSGGVTADKDTVLRFLSAHLPAHISVSVPLVPPIVGALAYAQELADND